MLNFSDHFCFVPPEFKNPYIYKFFPKYFDHMSFFKNNFNILGSKCTKYNPSDFMSSHLISYKKLVTQVYL